MHLLNNVILVMQRMDSPHHVVRSRVDSSLQASRAMLKMDHVILLKYVLEHRELFGDKQDGTILTLGL